MPGASVETVSILVATVGIVAPTLFYAGMMWGQVRGMGARLERVEGRLDRHETQLAEMGEEVRFASAASTDRSDTARVKQPEDE